MWHPLFLGLLLGWGAAIPIGPMNLEIIRRNLRYGALTGFSMGLGACIADVTYLILLSVGAFAILRHPLILNIVSILGALLLLYFALAIFKQKPSPREEIASPPKKAYYGWHIMQGYFLTLVNPYTILFWASVSAQVAVMSKGSHVAAIAMGVGVTLSTVSWISALNIAIHKVRHKLSTKTIHVLNYVGATLLLIFAGMSFYHVFF